MSLSGLEELEALERSLLGLEEAAAARAAPDVLEVAKGQWTAGQGPDGSPWPLTRDGQVPLVDLTQQARARAEGPEIVLELPDELVYHQHPHQPGHPRRQLVPDEGEAAPAAWDATVADAVDAELGGRG